MKGGKLDNKKQKKQNVTIKLYPEMIKELDDTCKKTGLKKNTLIEQGIELRLNQLKNKDF